MKVAHQFGILEIELLGCAFDQQTTIIFFFSRKENFNFLEISPNLNGK